ncbi:hypothetical protein [Corynebacterium flavescens]|uniref:hypothetical protein n=1 Tax=Corynebacterium flavescens TaxID=28028 RepID=UPI000AA9AA2C|nr:hypothetical protein [Corynebacterium flavescens]KAA8720541.1 hypothetical protein F4V60_09595 [Corynebacterium flavescens]
MDESLKWLSLVTFYFGSKALGDPSSDGVVKVAARRAYRDLNRTLRGIGTHKDRDHLVNATYDSLVSFVSGLNTVTDQSDFDERHARWCRDRIEFFTAHPHQDRSEFCLNYGQAQKWINMTLKYLAVLGCPAVEKAYAYLHVPVDSIVFDVAQEPSPGLGVARPPKQVAWSKLGEEDYLSYQKRLREATAEFYGSPLDWEAQAWANRLHQKGESA